MKIEISKVPALKGLGSEDFRILLTIIASYALWSFKTKCRIDGCEINSS